MTNFTLNLTFGVTREQSPRVVVADAYWSFAPATWSSLASFEAHWQCVATCARLRALAEAIRADRCEVAA